MESPLRMGVSVVVEAMQEASSTLSVPADKALLFCKRDKWLDVEIDDACFVTTMDEALVHDEFVYSLTEAPHTVVATPDRTE